MPSRMTESSTVLQNRCTVVQKKDTPLRKPRNSGGLAEGGQGAADVCDKENEEDDDVHTVLAGAHWPGAGAG